MRRLLVPCALAVTVVVSATAAPTRRANPQADCTRTSTGLVPLPDLRTGTYRGFKGGLYPGGRNAPSAAYLKRGLAAAKLVRPVNGKIVVLSVGMSNTTQEFQAFMQLARPDSRVSRLVTVVDGAQGGQDATRVADAQAPFWSIVGERLTRAGATASQVQVVWLKEAHARPTDPFPAHAQRLRRDLRTIVGILRTRFRNLHLVYVSSRTYGGYASTPLNPEPYAYESGFAVKWLVQDRIENRIRGPWVGWGPYLWTDGERGRGDGFTWSCADTREDGTHPSDSGRRKVAELLLRHLTTDQTARSWFVAR
jgi:hypothetical protein